MALADVDGDGDLDAFLANGRNENVEPNTVWLNDGTGRFHDSGQRLGEMDSYSVALGDFDADGDLDALVGNIASCETLKNDGSGRFLTRQWLSIPEDSGAWNWAVASGDLDGDGDLDGFLGGCCGATRSRGGPGATRTAVLSSFNMVWLNDGAGNFQDNGQRLGIWGSYGVALGDIDGDGDLDAFVGNWPERPDTVWLNDGSGQFTESGQRLGNARGRAVALGDVDGDGDLDAFVGNNGANEVWLNDGGAQGGALGNFSDSGQALGNADTRVVTLADLDGDRDLDAFVGNKTTGEVWLNDGAGQFRDSGQSMPYSWNHAVDLGDVDGNGALDIFAGRYDHHYRVWYNDGSGRFRRHSPGGSILYWLAGSGAVIIGLSLLGWWFARHRWQS